MSDKEELIKIREELQNLRKDQNKNAETGPVSAIIQIIFYGFLLYLLLSAVF